MKDHSTTAPEIYHKTAKKKIQSLHPHPHYYYYLFGFAVFAISVISVRLYFLYQENGSIFTPSLTNSSEDDLEACVSEVWCSTTIPRTSFFRFDTPINDLKRWRKAQNQAARGDPVLLQRILTFFPNYMDFLDGDIYFRSTHKIADFHVDNEHDFSLLMKNGSIKENYPDETGIPPVYHAEQFNRAPIIKAGYHYFDGTDGSPPFQGKKTKEAIVGRGAIFQHIFGIEKEIHHPFILINIFNENWGLLSTLFPNRTTDWSLCCLPKEYERLDRLLNNPKLLALFINQHSNYSHPKLLALPRGLPIHDDNAKQMIWDTMRLSSRQQKNSLLFTASSNWRFRPRIKQCIAKKFEGEKETVTFLGYNDSVIGRITPAEYYQRLAAARMSIALPGLGYDTFRLWESLTFGLVPVLERGVGLDKTLWRLPALLVDDYDDVTPDLLRTAYVEALYRVEEFEFERLTQSFWWTLILTMSRTKSSQPLLDKFPPQAEDPTFMRPREAFDCKGWFDCGRGTKRFPRTPC